MSKRRGKAKNQEPSEKPKREKTPTFLLELSLHVSPAQAKRLRAHLEAARAFYNTILSEGLRRLRRMRADPGWKRARAIPHAQKDQRRAAFAALQETHGFSEYGLHAYAREARCSWIADHLQAVLAQTLATRAYRALNRVCIGKARRVRFKSRGRGMGSVENKRNDTGLRFVLQDPKEGNAGWLIWGEEQMEACIDWNDAVVAHGLRHPIKYARLLQRRASSVQAQGADAAGYRYCVQLALKGHPHHKGKHTVGTDTLGLDLGPQTLAMVSTEGEARLELFCAELGEQQPPITRLQRHLDRQRRAANPDHYDEKGRIKKPTAGTRLIWKTSKSAEKTRRRLGEQHRKQAAHRKSLHGRLVHQLLAVGNTIIIEKISYKAWQKQFGKSVGRRAPGMFVAWLKRTVASTGGTLTEVSTRQSRLSQYCHGCGRAVKKSLGERWHQCACGVGPVQRDLYSAFLAAFLDPKNPSPSHARYPQYWEGAEACLRTAWEEVKERAKEGQCLPQSMGVPRARARLSRSFVESQQELCFRHGRVEALGGRKNPPA